MKTMFILKLIENQKLGILEIKEEGLRKKHFPVQNNLYMTYDTFAEILQSFNILQNSSNNTLHTLNYALNARDFACVF